MRKHLAQNTLRIVRDTGMIAPGDRVAVAVSGGADSVALFRVLLALRETIGFSILVVHYDHCLRGAASDADAKFVAALAGEHGIEFIGDREEVAAIAAQQRLNLEDAARRLRYAFFHRVVEQGFATRVAVAHTADDQAETVLARLLRGTGTTGLGGAYPIVGPIIRPLLTIRRSDLRNYLKDLGQSWREDLTNLDLRRQRARIRAQLLPVLERDFSPSIVGHLADLARFSREERDFWHSLVENLFGIHVSEAKGTFRIHIQDLLSPLRLSPAPKSVSSAEASASSSVSHTQRPLTERLVRRLYESVRGDCRDLSAVHVEQVIHLASESASGREIELPGGVRVQHNFDSLEFSRRPRRDCQIEAAETKTGAPAYQYTVAIPEHGVTAISVPELESRFLLKVIDWPCPERDTSQYNVLDVRLLCNPLILRSWKPGDAYRPRGHRQARKVKHLFLAHRVPRRERSRWPVIECGGHIVWVRGMPLAADFCAGGNTRSGMLIEESSL
jgi:tRNA(Ile)-lysidine synthase